MLVNGNDLLLDSKTETNEITDDLKNGEGYHNPSTKINCALSVEVDPTNVAIYVCKSSTQCFNFKALKCCGSSDIKIEPANNQGWYYHNYEWKKIVPNFGTFMFGNGAICFCPDDDLEPGDFKTLTFKAKSCGVDVYFDATFVYDPCKCCCAGSACNSCCH